jgi:rubrerythrin
LEAQEAHEKDGAELEMTAREMLEQMRNARGNQEPRRVFICPFCGQCFYNVETLIDHQDDTGHVFPEPSG